MIDIVIRASRDIRLSSDGRALVLRTWAGEPPKAAHQPLEARDVRPWLEKSLPRTAACICLLVHSLNIMRTTVHVSDALPYDPLAEAQGAMQTLKARLPMLIDSGRQRAKNELAAAFEHLLMAVRRADCLVQPSAPSPHKHIPWHDDAMWLVYVLRQAAAPKPVSISAAGPGTRFLQKALHSVWGLELKGDQIKQAVARYSHGLMPNIAVLRSGDNSPTQSVPGTILPPRLSQ